MDQGKVAPAYCRRFLSMERDRCAVFSATVVSGERIVWSRLKEKRWRSIFVSSRYPMFACIYIPGFLVQAVARAEPGLRGERVALALLGEGAAVERGGGKCRGAERGNAAGNDESAGGGIFRRGNAAPLGSAGKGDACGVAGCGLVHFAAGGR